MTVSLITAMDDNRTIGFNNTLPWHIPEDLKHFKETTKGCTVIMGRKTYDSLGIYKPLPNRINVVISRTQTKDNKNPFVLFNDSLEQAIEDHKDEEVFIIGGAEIYKQALPLVDSMYITHVEGKHDGDTFFPEFDKSEWNIKSVGFGEGCEFLLYERK